MDNSHIGYGGMPEMPYDPNDKRSMAERIYDLIRQMLFAYAIGVLLLILIGFFFGSCSAHRTMNEVVTSNGDSNVTELVQSTTVAKRDTSLTSTATVSGSFSAGYTTFEEEETETINETIVEVTDSTGTTTKTTNRTTMRKRKATEQTTSLLDEYAADVALNLHLSALDSAFNATHVEVNTHLNDSISKTTQDNAKFTLIDAPMDMLLKALFALFLFVLAYIGTQYCRGK